MSVTKFPTIYEYNSSRGLSLKMQVFSKDIQVYFWLQPWSLYVLTGSQSFYELD